jgi:hypothetical protein
MFKARTLPPVPVSEQQSVDLVLPARAALAVLMQGEAAVENINEIAAISNVAMILQEEPFGGYGTDYTQDVFDGQAAVIRIVERAGVRRRVLATGNELNCLRTLIDVYEAMLQVVPQTDVQRAVAEAYKRSSENRLQYGISMEQVMNAAADKGDFRGLV